MKVKNSGKRNKQGELIEKSARPRFHVYFPLAKMYTDPADIRALKDKLVEAFPFLDGNAKDASRFIYGVSDPKIGLSLDKEFCIDQVQLTTPEQEKKFSEVKNMPMPKMMQKDLPAEAEIVQALSCINPDCEYNQWAEIGMALQDGGYGFDVFDKWSSGGKKYVSKDDCYTHWKSFHNDKGITIATLFYYAQEGGYLTPSKRYEAGHCVDVDHTKSLPTEQIKDTPFPSMDMLTQTGQAEMANIFYGEKIRYVNEWGWMAFLKTCWMSCQEIGNKVLLSLGKKQREHLRDTPPSNADTFNKLSKFTVRAQEYGFIRGAEELLQTKCSCSAIDFNTDNSIINCDGVIVNLKNGEMREIEPGDLITLSTLHKPSVDDEGREMWLNFLKSVLVKKDGITPDEDLIVYLQRWLGAALLCDNPDPTALIAFGVGANGKSTLFNTIAKVLGGYSRVLNSDILDKKQQNGRFALADLFGARLAIFPELPAGATLDEAMIKKIASRDPIVGERKFKDTFPFTPTHSPVVYTNTLPTIKAKDYGTWRRIVIVPFYRVFPQGQRDAFLAQNLLEKCGGAIMKWLIDGAIWAYEHKYDIPEPLAVKTLTDQYREEQDWVMSFIKDSGYIVDGTGRTPKADIWKAYQEWAYGEGMKRITKNKLWRELRASFGNKLGKDQDSYQNGERTVFLPGIHKNDTSNNS